MREVARVQASGSGPPMRRRQLLPSGAQVRGLPEAASLLARKLLAYLWAASSRDGRLAVFGFGLPRARYIVRPFTVMFALVHWTV